MNPSLLATLFLTVFVFQTGLANAQNEDLAFVASEELDKELEARNSDIQRTKVRIKEIEQTLQTSAADVNKAKRNLDKLEKQLSERAQALYRLSRHGKALRYLFTAKSAVSFLKRMETLKHLVVTGLIARRDAGNTLTNAQADVNSARANLEGAFQMLSMLESARDELKTEKSRRIHSDKIDPLLKKGQSLAQSF